MGPANLILLLSLSFAISKTLYAANRPSPPLVLLPWLNINLNPDDIGRGKEGLEQSFESLNRLVFTEPQPLSDYLKQQTPGQAIGLNTIRTTSKMITGTARWQDVQPATAIQPVLCSTYEHIVVGLAIQDYDAQIFQSLAHRTIPRQQWSKDLEEKTLGQTLNQVHRDLLTTLPREITARQIPPPSPVKIRLGLDHNNTRRDQTSNLCLNLLLTNSLSNEFRMVSSLGNESLFLLKDLLGQTTAPQRQNRHFTLRWTPKNPKTTDIGQGIPFELRSYPSEAVFAHPITPPITDQLTLSLGDDGRMNLTQTPALNALIAQENTSLASDELPRVAAIDRAWVYLDKGRAWGLKMNDRLVAKMGDEQIKGHVVGFYGPGLKLTSIHGYPIHEGAIIYVRKGQRKTEKGLTFSFDPQTFPTPWPPQKQ